jgi:hypothetical protein
MYQFELLWEKLYLGANRARGSFYGESCERVTMQSGRTQYGVELKYCERCGTLGLRCDDSNQVYCSQCAQDMSEVYRAPSRESRERTSSSFGLAKKPCESVMADENLGAMQRGECL